MRSPLIPRQVFSKTLPDNLEKPGVSRYTPVI